MFSFVDLNSGCPIDTITSRGCGSALLTKPQKLVEVVAAMCDCLPSRQVTVKIRTGWDEKKPMAHKLIPMLQKMSHGRIAAVMIHGRSRSQRYSKDANWDYILEAARSQGNLSTHTHTHTYTHYQYYLSTLLINNSIVNLIIFRFTLILMRFQNVFIFPSQILIILVYQSLAMGISLVGKIGKVI